MSFCEKGQKTIIMVTAKVGDHSLQSEPIKSSNLIEKSDFRAWTGKLPKWNCEISWKPWNSWYRAQSNQDRTWNHQKIQWESRWLGQNQVWTRGNEAEVENSRKFRILVGTGNIKKICDWYSRVQKST